MKMTPKEFSPGFKYFINRLQEMIKFWVWFCGLAFRLINYAVLPLDMLCCL